MNREVLHPLVAPTAGVPRARRGMLLAALVLTGTALGAGTVQADDAQDHPEALPLRDQVRIMTGQPQQRPDRERNPAAGNSAPAAYSIDTDQPTRARNLRFGAGYETRMGIGFATGAGAGRR